MAKDSALEKYGLLAGIDEVRILLTLDRIGPYAKHAIFALQNYVHPGRNMIGHQGGHADTEIHIESVAQFPSDSLDNALALFNVFG
jgi:hypothetical protein